MAASINDVSGKAFDYIVIGGGTAGLVVATRLSEDSTVSVLVLEAGPANLDDPLILGTGSYGGLLANPKYDWGFTTRRKKDATIDLFIGRGLGGSTAINFFQYHRPPKGDIDTWEQLGNPGWNWDRLEKYYTMVEQFVPPSDKDETMSYDVQKRGDNGPVIIAYPTQQSFLEKPYQDFSGNTTGTWLTPLTVHPHSRIRTYAANSYYQPNASRQNLTVLVSAHVAKIHVLKDTNSTAIATSVEFIHEGTRYEAMVSKEVILSAGAIMSPQILELSGIGDPAVLNAASIPVNIDLPGVGTNVQEHVYAGMTYEIREDKYDEVVTMDILTDPDELVKQAAVAKQTGKGPGAIGATSMACLPLASISPDARAIQHDLLACAPPVSPALQKQFRVQRAQIAAGAPSLEMVLAPRQNAYGKPFKPHRKHIFLTALLNHPFSRGTIHVASSDPSEYPVIDPHDFENEYDLRTIVETMNLNRRVTQQEPLKSMLTGVEVSPGSETQTDEQLAEFYKDNFSTAFHTVGSCSMLPLEDGGVVDPQLKVYHTSNIRLIDLSIAPLHVAGHMQATAYAIGELGADIVKGLAS